ncbi:UvrD-helicase domain-containing protein [Nocardioides sp. CER19]|uniref:HelD family protein n=1 Tax=Nocardioides sp. CER19 TaxID=3038538 RepID=UPI00244B1AA6|nr:UvrD-helicase domain-containing protein [Nocardioides sp. CER19]MDH2412667.1 AAA family ATPase [Nocardioides sp. CER19]
MSEELVEQEIAREQAFVDQVYVQLEKSAKSAQALATEGHARGGLGHEGGLVERDAMVFQAARRIAQLDAAHEGLVFGRLDLRAEVDGEPRYIGRIGLRDENRDSLLIDWRAPAAAVFYQATAAEPQNVVRRRVLRSRGRDVLGVEDELLDAEAQTELPIVGEGALMAQLSRARDRQMHSIVATIQAEQDKAIRAPGKGVVSISGGPGVGKTVVALHRAAYLLYTDRRRYEAGGVLIVGPSGVFMTYISRVLPSLGETAVALRSLGEVVDGVRATRHDEPAVAAVKGSASMAEVLRRAARQQAPGSPSEFRIFYRDDVLTLDRGRLGTIRRQLMSQGRRNKQLPRVANTLLDALWRQVRGERGRERGKEAFEDEMLGDQRFLDFAGTWWPALDAQTVLGWLRDPEFLARVGDGVVSSEDQALLLKSWSSHPGDLSIQDVPLLDELRYALGDMPETPTDERDVDPELGINVQELMTAADREFAGGPGWRPPTNRIEDDPFAHVLIDEAQDLTPMQWRMVGRRGRTASWTIVGDPAQSSWPVPAEAAAARAEALEGKQVHEFHLGTNYRNSAEIYDFAAAYAERVGLDADLPTAVRSTGVEPVVLGLPGEPVPDLEAATRAEVARLAGEVAGTVGIVVPVARRSEVNSWLASWPELAEDAPSARASAADAGTTPSGEDRVVVLTGLDTKGLEFDGIVVVRPQEIEDESPTGRATLYVVLTRATQLLTTIS